MSCEPTNLLKEVKVWDRTVRCFHWFNALLVFTMIGLGLVIYFGSQLGLSLSGKVLIKSIHVYVGYLFALNLLWRLLWASFKSGYSGWKSILPIGKGYLSQLKNELKAKCSNIEKPALGHTPLGKLMTGLLMLLLVSAGVTGLVLASTDLYLPPFGHQVAEYIADDPLNVDKIKPGDKVSFINQEAYTQMRAIRKPFIVIHEYTFYLLLVAIVLHITAVILTEVKFRSGLISAMFTGYKNVRDDSKDKLH